MPGLSPHTARTGKKVNGLFPKSCIPSNILLSPR